MERPTWQQKKSPVKQEKPKDYERILVEHLKALIFQKDYQDCQNCLGIVLDDLDVPNPKQFKEKISSFLGKPITWKSLQEIKIKVIEYYRNKGFPLVAVRIPSGQDISTGRVHILIHRARLGTVSVEGAKYFSATKMAKDIRTKEGQIIKNSKMVEDLEWLNDNPFRLVNMIYQKGKNLSETDVILKVKDSYPLRVYGGYENSGNAIAGPSRWLGGFNWGNVWGLEHQLNAQFISASNAKKLWAVVGSYVAPFSFRQTLRLFGSYAVTEPGIEELSDLKGKGWSIGVRYDFCLPNFRRYSHDFILGYDFKRTNNYLTYVKNLIFNTDLDISQFLVKYQAMLDDAYGVNSLELLLFLSPGGMTNKNKNALFDLARTGAKANYIYGQLDYERLTKIKNWSWIFNFIGQLSGGKLLPSEQLSVGGYTTVRGYMENMVAGDKGFILKNEIRTPAWRLTIKKIKSELQLLGFVDLGAVTEADQRIISENSAVLLSIGPGLRYNMGKYIALRFDYGWQLIDVKGRLFGSESDSRAHVGVTVAF